MDLDPRPHHHQHSDMRTTPAFLQGYAPAAPTFKDPAPSRLPPAHPANQWLPDIGQTRCYWALLSSSLKFLFLDPVLAYHLKEQATAILDNSLLDFVHPDEKESARADLGGVLDAKTLHGSITRVRYCRLSCVRRILGFVPRTETPDYPSTFPADRISVDANYMAVDIVINWVADGLVLCFMHAVVDMKPEDNDESLRTGWSNWCSTYGFDEQRASDMSRSLYERVPSTISPYQMADGSLRMLQILRNEPERSLLVSWPPDPSPRYAAQHHLGIPSASDLAQLVKHVKIDGGGGEAKTSCTRRFKSSRPISVSDPYGSLKQVEVESIFIPHGTVIFACHKINTATSLSYAPPPPLNNAPNAYAPVQPGYPYPYTHPSHEARGYGDENTLYGTPYLEDGLHQQINTQTYVERWVEGQSHAHMPPPQEDPWPHSESSTSSPVIPQNGRLNEPDMSAGPDSFIPYAQAHHNPTWTNPPAFHSPAYAQSLIGSTRPQSPALTTNTHYTHTPSLPAADTPLKGSQKGSPASSQKVKLTHSPPPLSSGMDEDSPKPGAASADSSTAGSLRCTSCGVTHSPEWRKGPSGKKDLCNACGLRFARSRAKKDGVSVRKRPSGKQLARPLAPGVGPSRTATSDRPRASRSFSRGGKQQIPTESRSSSSSFASTLLDASYLVSLAHSAPAPSLQPPPKDIPIDPSLTAPPSTSPSPPTSSIATSSNYTGNGDCGHARSQRVGARPGPYHQPFTPPESSYGLPTPSPKYAPNGYERPAQRHDSKNPIGAQSYLPSRHSTDNSLRYALGKDCDPSDKLLGDQAGGGGIDHLAAMRLPPTPLSASHSFVRGDVRPPAKAANDYLW